MLKIEYKNEARFRIWLYSFFFCLTTFFLSFFANTRSDGFFRNLPDSYRFFVVYSLIAILASAVCCSIISLRIIRNKDTPDNLFGIYIFCFLVTCPFMPLLSNIRIFISEYFCFPFAVFCIFFVLLHKKLYPLTLLCSLPFCLSAFFDNNILNIFRFQRFLYLPLMLIALFFFSFSISKSKLSKLFFVLFIAVNTVLLLVGAKFNRIVFSPQETFRISVILSEMAYTIPTIITVFLLLRSSFQKFGQQKLFSLWFSGTLLSVGLSILTTSRFIPYGLSVIALSQLFFLVVLWVQEKQEMNLILSSRPVLYFALLIINSLVGYTNFFY